jgi:hypothetical protein
MDGSSPDLVLKELKRIKWLLVLLVVALLSLPASLLYIGWEVVSLLQDNQVEEEQGTVETMVENFPRPGDAQGRLIHRPACDE